MPERRFPPP
jgi:hypothetical protein